jgi:hypothetical protein
MPSADTLDRPFHFLALACCAALLLLGVACG